MEKFTLIRFDHADALASAVASAWLNDISTADRAGRPYCVALSGGRITLKLFAAAIELVKTRQVPLEGVHFFWADERCVPPDDPESNFAAADKHFFRPLGVANDGIHRIPGEQSPERAAELASAEIRRVVTDNPGGQPALDLILLGMGEDGHVASLFPAEPASAMTDASVYRAIHNSPKPPPNRVTLSYAAITAAREVWVLAAGTGKEAAFRESLSPDGQTPLARVLHLRSETRIFTDIAVG